MKQPHLLPRALCTLAIAASLIPTAQAAVGRTVGNFDVSTTGAATYTIPIWVPPGPRGVQPGLALVYNSQGGNGNLGVGWSLAGLSSISRCNQTVIQDGTAAGVALTYADKFCLDGKRLRLTGGNYGYDGSAYQTEIADFSQVTAAGTAGNEPATFTVRAKDGATYEYGNGGNSRVLASGSTTASAWMLNKVTDRTGNTMIVTYQAPDANVQGATLPLTVAWTPSSKGSGSYNYAVNFQYQSVNVAPTAGYLAGTVVKDAYLLTNVLVQSGTTVIRNYAMTYAASNTTARQLLGSVQECTDVAATDCLSPTQFTYQSGQAGVGGSNTLVSSGSTASTGIRSAFDFNADGRNDLAWTDNGTWRVALGSNSGYGTPINTGLAGILEDVTGNGVDGILGNNGGTWWFYTLSGSSFSGVTTNAPVDSASAYLADVDADGRPDLVTENADGYLYVRLNNSTGSSPAFAATATQTIADTFIDLLTAFYGSSARKLDFYGSGRQDLVGVTYYCNQWAEVYGEQVCFGYAFDYTLLHFNGSTFVPTALYTGGNSQDWAVGMEDYNDDGCTDVMAMTGVAVSDCNGSIAAVLTTPAGTVVIGSLDWNGDGRNDILVSQTNGYVGVVLSNGSELSTNVISTSVPYTNNSTYSGIVNPTGDGLDGLAVFAGSSPFSVQYHLHTGSGQRPDLLVSATDGFGINASPGYGSIAQGSYTKSTDAAYPHRNFIGPMHVVNQVSSSDGIGGTYTSQYSYTGGWTHLSGYGFEGFASRKVVDSRSDAPVLYSWYSRPFPTTGLLVQQDVFQHNDSTLISRATFTPGTPQLLDNSTDNRRQFVFVSSANQLTYEVGGTRNGQLITTTAQAYVYKTNSTGNLESVAITVTDSDGTSPYSGQSWTSTTTHSYAASPDFTNWCFGLPTSTSVMNSAPGKPTLTRRVDYSVSYPKCRVTQEIAEPQSGTYAVTKTFRFDDDAGDSQPDFGNVTGIDVAGVGMAVRTTSILWADANRTTGQFPLRVTNPLGQATLMDYDFTRGVLSSSTDPNGLATSWLYDSFARRTRETGTDGNYVETGYTSCDASNSYCDITHARLHTTLTRKGSDNSVITTQHVYTDGLGRVRQQEETGFNGQLTRTITTYDARGRVVTQSVPHQTTAYYAQLSHDALGRLTLAQRPISAGNGALQSTQYFYEGRTTRVIDAEGKETRQIAQVTGTLGRSQDPNGYYQGFSYDSFGSLLSVTDSETAALFTATYDYGVGALQRTASDMDRGASTFTYNALGELTASTDNKGQNFDYLYDALSRPTQRRDGMVGGTPELQTNWVWGNSAGNRNIGQLESVTAGNYAESYFYTVKGQVQQRRITQLGTAYDFDYTYDAKGQGETLTYPVSTYGYRLKLDYAYQNGYLQRIRDFNAPTTVYWQANTMNPLGQVTQETLGNGVVTNRTFDAVTGWMSAATSGVGGGATLQNDGYLYDRVGNNTQRQNNNVGLTENFFYDGAYRLDYSQLNNVENLNLAYNLNGNISSRTDVAGNAAWTYHASKGHAVIQAGSGGPSFTYDANGNATTRNGASINWTSYNHPAVINGSGEQVSFTYNHAHERWRAIYSGPTGTETTFFISELLEKVQPAGSEIWRHFIFAGNTKVAVIGRQSTGPNSNTVWYLREDHLGSLTGIIDANGVSYVKASYGAYGLRRSSCTWAGEMTSGNLSKLEEVTRHGYTWHTALGRMGLNDMNGRVQDAVTGRFLSPDPYITEPENTQNFNRYSYVYNNPLSYIDPSGFAACYGSEDTCQGMDSNPLPEVLVLGTPGFAATFDVMSAWQFATLVTSWDQRNTSQSQQPFNNAGGTGEHELGEVQIVATKLPSRQAGKKGGIVYSVFVAPFGGAFDCMLNSGLPNQCGWSGGAMAAGEFVFAAMTAAQRAALGIAKGAAQTATNAAKLSKQLGSQEGMAELLLGGGKAIAGAGTNVPLRDVGRLVNQYGGNASDWAKITSTASGHMQTHAYRNVVTGEIVELKSIIP